MDKCIRLLLVLLVGMPISVLADGVGFGGMADNMMQPVNVVTGFMNTACFVIGGSFLFASIVKYFEHRRSPLMVPISTVIFLSIAGVVLIILPFASKITGIGA